MKTRRLLALTLVGGASLGIAVSASARTDQAGPAIPAFTPQQLTEPSGENFVGWNGNIYNQRYSTLNQINASNVRNLKLVWHRRLVLPRQKLKIGQFGVLGAQSPVVYGGMVYMPDHHRRVWAINAATGERVWTAAPRLKKLRGLGQSIPIRGVSIGDGKVFIAASDASVIALNQSTGRIAWRRAVLDNRRGHAYTAAPAYYDGKLILPGTGADSGGAPVVMAIDAKTGRELWRFNIIPQKPSDPGWNTWATRGNRKWFKGEPVWNGGGSVWETPAIDPELGLVYFGTGNADPWSAMRFRGPGDHLFTNSLVALDINTGRLRWHYQVTHHDIWDYACPNNIILFDLPRAGQQPVKGVAMACKQGYLYLFNRATGRPLYGINERPVPQLRSQYTAKTQPIPVGEPFSSLCPPRRYVGRTGPDGKPFRVGCIYEPYDHTRYTVTAPGALGGANWPPSAYSPRTNYMYICSKDSVGLFKSVQPNRIRLRIFGDMSQQQSTPGPKMTGQLVAMNLRNNRVAWRKRFGELCYSGVLATAGDIVFVGRGTNFLEAYHARTGRRLWRSPKLLAGVNAAPVTYTANGKQYVTVYAGGHGIAAFGGLQSTFGNSLYTFAIPS
jgi:quinohemoprotein ethanol dehydrogenase